MNWRALLRCIGPVGFWLAAALTAAAQTDGQAGLSRFELPRSETPQPMVDLRPLQQDIVYIDQLSGEIPMGRRPITVPDPPSDPIDYYGIIERIGPFAKVGLALLTALLIWVLWRNRWAIAERLRGAPATPTSQAVSTPRRADRAPDASGLIARLRGMADRRAALVMLLRAVLNEAAQQNGLRLGQSETARDLLRRLPKEWPHLGPTRDLVMTEELVQFGGRPLPDPLFEACLNQAVPILRAPRTL